MAKDPAFLLYPQDFLIGCAEMTNEQIGQYFRILCYIHQKGRMTDKTISLLVGSISDIVRLKFGLDENGCLVNKRLEEEIQKRANFVKSRKDNGSMGGRPKKQKPSGKPKQNLPEDVNVNKDVNIIYPYNGEKFKIVWGMWKEYKKKEHGFSYKTTISEQGALDKLKKISNNSEQASIEIIKESISQGWEGFFKLKNENNGTKQTSGLSQEWRESLQEDLYKPEDLQHGDSNPL